MDNELGILSRRDGMKKWYIKVTEVLDPRVNSILETSWHSTDSLEDICAHITMCYEPVRVFIAPALV